MKQTISSNTENNKLNRPFSGEQDTLKLEEIPEQKCKLMKTLIETATKLYGELRGA